MTTRTTSAFRARADFNGDGYSDLAVGSYGESLPGLRDVGAVSVIYGSASGLTSTANQFFTEDTPGMPGGGAAKRDVFGRSLVAGDFNGDGYWDLAVGAYGKDVDGVPSAGAVTILFGSPAGLTTDGAQWWTEDSPGIPGNPAALDDQFGHYFGSGDFNSDGFADLAVGSDERDIDGVTDAGSTTLLYGSPSGLTADGAQLWTADSPGMPGPGAAAGDMMGRSYSSGDFNGDGFADLVITVYLKRVDGFKEAGSVYVLYGSATGLQDDGTGGPPAQFLTQDTPGMAGDGSEAGDNWGRQPAAGDFNGDGYSDVAIGAWLEAVDTILRAGAVTILYGSPAGLTTNGSQWFTQNSAGMAGDGAEAADQWSRADVAGDFNGDGYADLAVGAYGEAVDGFTQAGAFIVMYGSAAGLSTTGSQFWSQDSPSVKEQCEASDQFGKGVGVGDFNDDGIADLAVGAYWDSVGSIPKAGVVNVLYGTAAHGIQALSPDDQLWAQGRNGLLDQPEKEDRFGWIFG